MIKAHFESYGYATLRGTTWTVPLFPLFAELLNTKLPAIVDTSPSIPNPELAIAETAVKMFGGEILEMTGNELRKDVVY